MSSTSEAVAEHRASRGPRHRTGFRPRERQGMLPVMFGLGTIEILILYLVLAAIAVFLGWILVRATRR